LERQPGERTDFDFDQLIQTLNYLLTLLITLYLRAMETQRPDALIKDEKAVALVAQMNYDPTDILSSELLGWGLKRTMTLAEGAERCDFRFKKGGETRVAVPEPLERCIQSRRPSDGRGTIIPKAASRTAGLRRR